MVLRDPNTLDLTQQRLCIAEDIRFWPVRERGELVYRIEIPKLHRFFRVGYEEYVFISLLDGKTTIPQACGLAAAKLASRAPTAQQAGVIGRWLLEHDLAYLESDGPPVRRLDAPGAGAATSAGALKGLFRRLNPFWIKLPLPHSERWINGAARLSRSLLDTRMVVLGCALMAAAAIVLVGHRAEFMSSSANIFHPNNWLCLIATWIGLKLVHELAHAIACDRQGGKVRESGIVFILFAPLAYVDVTSCWRMNSRWSRMIVAAAGMYIELVIAAVAVLVWASTDVPQYRFLLHNLVFAAGLSTLLFNANVLMRFDGYFILADLIEVPNLYSEATSAVRRVAKRLLVGEDQGASTLTGWRKHFVLGYGLGAIVWKVVICVSLSIAASTMFAGAGVALAVMGIVLWFGGPLAQLYRFASELRGRDPSRFVRFSMLSAACITAAYGLGFWMPFPTSVKVPAAAQYLPETMVRSRASGFVSSIHVGDGDSVRKGQLLLELENRDLTNQVNRLEITRRQNEIRLRQATDKHDAGQRQVLLENQKAVEEQLQQLRSQTAGLRVVAPRDGTVVARRLKTRIGTYVHEGDSILVVADGNDKELVAYIDQDSIEAVRPLVGSEVNVRTARFEKWTGRLEQIEPRASDELTLAALGATEGGSLAVQAASTDEGSESLVLLEPHFRARIALATDVAPRVSAGTRMTASLGYRSEPIATRLAQSIRRLWYSAQDNSTDY